VSFLKSRTRRSEAKRKLVEAKRTEVAKSRFVSGSARYKGTIFLDDCAARIFFGIDDEAAARYPPPLLRRSRLL
jgi:hypothetical protein